MSPEEKWVTLREWLEHDKSCGHSAKVSRALFLMDEIDLIGKITTPDKD